MDRYYTRAYMNERLQDAEHRRLAAHVSSQNANRTLLLGRMESRSRLTSSFIRPKANAGAVTPMAYFDLECCAA